MATTLAPNPTLAKIARMAHKSHIGEEEGRVRKRVAESAPM